MNADHFRGLTPETYDETRRGKPEWPIEQEAVEAFVVNGPVLDAPIGTGRYVDIYRAKGLKFVGLDISPEMVAYAKRKHHDLTAFVGSIFALPFGEREFETVVCSRLLNWLYPADMARALRELRRVANCLVVSIRTGHEGDVGNYTHDVEKFYAAIDGLFIEKRQLIRSVPTGDFEMFKLRPPRLADVHDAFERYEYIADRIAGRWARHFGVVPVPAAKSKLRAEYWSNVRIGQIISDMSSFETVDGIKSEIVTDEPPRSDAGSLIALRIQSGREMFLDGRRRANKWMKQNGSYPVLVIDWS